MNDQLQLEVLKLIKRPFFPLILLLPVLLLAGIAQANQVGTTQYLPLIQKAISCEIPGTSYTATLPPGGGDGIPTHLHPDVNLAIRGYEPTQTSLTLVDYDGNTDSNAPQLYTLFGDQRVPAFSSAYQIHRWNWGCDCRGEVYDQWGTTLLGMATAPGEIIRVPDSGYDIGGGYDVMVLYATDERITLKYTREDDVVSGYTIHIEDVCVEPTLKALYNASNAGGRDELPVLRGDQALGRALGNEIKVSVRDTGAFLDPRSRKDWWQGR